MTIRELFGVTFPQAPVQLAQIPVPSPQAIVGRELVAAFERLPTVNLFIEKYNINIELLKPVLELTLAGLKIVYISENLTSCNDIPTSERNVKIW